MTTTFVKRKLEITFVLGEGSFGTEGQNTSTFSNLRVSAKINKAGGNALGTAEITIFGMTLSAMNKLSTLGLVPLSYKRNSVSLAAGVEGGAMSAVFEGTITDAWIDTQSAPEVAFRVQAHTGLFDAVAPNDPSSFTGEAQVEEILSGLATKMGLQFENSGVSITLSNPYFYGSARVQAQKVVEHAGIEWNGGDGGILAIWPRGSSRGSAVPLIAPDTGLIGYPAFSPVGIILRTLFNPSVSLGGKIDVKSSQQEVLDKANAAQTNQSQWVVVSIDHDLEANLPNGQWFSTINAAPLGYGPIPRR